MTETTDKKEIDLLRLLEVLQTKSIREWSHSTIYKQYHSGLKKFISEAERKKRLAAINHRTNQKEHYAEWEKTRNRCLYGYNYQLSSKGYFCFARFTENSSGDIFILRVETYQIPLVFDDPHRGFCLEEWILYPSDIGGDPAKTQSPIYNAANELYNDICQKIDQENKSRKHQAKESVYTELDALLEE